LNHQVDAADATPVPASPRESASAALSGRVSAWRGHLDAWLPLHWRIAPILTVTMIVLTVAFITTTTLLDISRSRRIYWDELHSRGDSLSAQMNDLLADPLYLSNVEDIEKTATLIASQPDIEYVRVFTPDGVVLADTSIDGFRYLGTEASPLGVRALEEGRLVEENDDSVLRVARPVTIEEQTIGGVEIGLRSDVLERQIRGIIIEHVIQGVILALVAAGIAYLIARTFSRPVQTLVTATNDMAAGRLDTRVSDVQGGELRELAGSFNHMARELETTIGELQESRRRIVGAQESVRREIATHLHGRVQARMLVLRTQLYRTMRRSDPSPEAEEQLNEVIGQLDDLIQNDITSLSRRLYPSILRRGLVPALQSLADQFEPSFAVRLEFGREFTDLEEADRDAISEAVKLAAYRIAEDALTNVLKHANASQATVRLDLRDGERLRLAVEDNGQGFDLDGSGRGLGLEAMQDYASAVGGSCEIWSSLGRGSVVTASLPISDPVEESS
jgi:signal transduction histidine kinase